MLWAWRSNLLSLGAFALAACSTGHALHILNAQQSMQGSQVPILTGCLELCGADDQACNTECEVCVEMSKCKDVTKDCDDCSKQARKSKAKSSTLSGWALDGGGIPIKQDNTRTRIQRAAFAVHEGWHDFREARLAVLNSHRQVEYAAQELEEQKKRLRTAKAALNEAESKMHKWELKSSRRLDKIDREIQQISERVQALEGDLKESFDNYEKTESYQDEVWELRQLLESERRRLAKAHARKAKQKDKAEWYGKKLKKASEAADQEMKKELKAYRELRAVGRLYHKNLKEAEENYKKQAENYKALTREQDTLLSEFHNYSQQLPWRHLSQQQARHATAEEARSHSASHKTRSSAGLMFLALMMLMSLDLLV